MSKKNNKKIVGGARIQSVDRINRNIYSVSEMQKKSYIEVNNSLEGKQWSVKKRFEVLEELYQRFCLLNPYPFKPIVKSFDSFEAYESWKKKQKNAWYW